MNKDSPQHLNKKFYNADGSLTIYALACGYIEEKETDQGHFTMWMEHGAFHVRGYSHDHERLMWDVFNNVTKARKKFLTAGGC
jgi:hypothetical protein